LWKGLYEAGVDLIVTPYRGRAVVSPWWRTYENPLFAEAETFAKVRAVAGRFPFRGRRREESDRTARRLIRDLIWRWVTPRWQRHLERIIERERVDAVLIFTVPMSHLRGVAAALRRRFSVPIAYYDGDAPMSLPEFGGMLSGFDVYEHADPSEYDLVISNSEGVRARLMQLGVRRAETLFWAADPEFFFPVAVRKEADVFFYGHGVAHRREALEHMIGQPSTALPSVDFAVGGYGFGDTIGRARELGAIPFNAFPRAISASRINVSVTRRPHAVVAASSTARLFELASCAAAIVSGPHLGIERWFDPGHELLVANGTEEAISAYRALLDDPTLADALGRAARARVLEDHTYLRRAKELLGLLNLAPNAVTLGSSS
jgi:spore maturation protein CgeB